MLKPLPRVTVYPRPVENEHEPAPLPRFVELPEPRALRVLDFDIENRPLSYWYDGKCTAEVTAIAWCFLDDLEGGECHLLTRDDESMISMLAAFSAAYAAADMVTGHYIRRHDLGIVQAALVENELPLLGSKLTSDTRLDLVKFQDLAKSQEALAAMLDVRSPKESMTQRDWREANRLTERGLSETYRRVVGDVRQHIELRAALLDRELLGPPRMWNPR